MSSQRLQEYEAASRILLGLECVFPEHQVVEKVRFAIETLGKEEDNTDKIYSDFFNIIKSIGNFPLTSHLEFFIHARSPVDKIKAILRIVGHLTYDVSAQYSLLIFNDASLDEIEDQRSINLLYKYLDELEFQCGSKAFYILKKILFEKSRFQNTKNLIELYYLVYDDPLFIQLRKSYEHLYSLNSSLEFFRFLGLQTDKKLFEGVRLAKKHFPKIDLKDGFSKGQIRSKVWAAKTLKEVLEEPPHSILNLCGWFALLVPILDEYWPKIKIDRVRSLDIDPDCCDIADNLNFERFYNNWKFKALTRDIFNLKLAETEQGWGPVFNMENIEGDRWEENMKFDLWVNTSCEHIADFPKWYDTIPSGQLVLLQSNDFFEIDDHVNCVNSVSEFRDQTPMSQRLYSGALTLEKYTRYMTIGYK